MSLRKVVDFRRVEVSPIAAQVAQLLAQHPLDIEDVRRECHRSDHPAVRAYHRYIPSHNSPLHTLPLHTLPLPTVTYRYLPCGPTTGMTTERHMPSDSQKLATWSADCTDME